MDTRVRESLRNDIFDRVNAACNALNLCEYPVPSGMTFGQTHLVMAESIKTINRVQEMGRRISLSLGEFDSEYLTKR